MARNLGGKGWRGLAALVAAALVALPGMAQAQDAAVDLAGITTAVDGLLDGGPWYGYRAADRYVVLNATDANGSYRFGFSGAAGNRRFELTARILDGGADSSIGLYCCRASDGSGTFLAVMLTPGGALTISRVEGGAFSQISSTSGHGKPEGTTLAFQEVPNGIQIFVDGQSVGSIENPSIVHDNGGIIIRGRGIYELTGFGLYLNN